MIRVLLVEPHRHPRLVEIEHTLENLQGLVGGYIAATYPWDDLVGLVYDDDALCKEGAEPNRTLEDYDLVHGPFFICGLGREDFASIPDDLALKYAEKYWMPESFMMLENALVVIREDDGTEPGEEFLHEVDRLSFKE